MFVDRQYYSSNLSSSRLNQFEFPSFINYVLSLNPTNEELTEILNDDISIGNIVSFTITDNGLNIVMAENALTINF